MIRDSVSGTPGTTFLISSSNVWLASLLLKRLTFICLALPWSLSSAKSRRGASVLSTPAGCVPWLESQRRICRSTPRCCRSSSFSACPFFDCLRLFPVISLWLGRPILSLTIWGSSICNNNFHKRLINVLRNQDRATKRT